MKLLPLALTAVFLAPSVHSHNQVDLSTTDFRSLVSAKYYSSSPSGMLTRVKITDVDKDGDEDIVYAAHHYAGRGVELGWLENTRPDDNAVYHTAFTKHIIHDAANFYHFEVEDIDGDGDLDILGATKATTRSGIIGPYQGKHIWLMKNDGQQNFERIVISETDADQMAIADFNMDGRTDFISAYGEQALIWQQQDDGSFVSQAIAELADSQLVAGASEKNLSLATSIHANDDDRPDVILAGGYYYRIFLNNIDGSWTEKHITQSDFCERSGHSAPFDRCLSYGLGHLQVTDIDGDGDDDIGVAGGESFGGLLAWLEQDNDGNFALHRFPMDTKANYQPEWKDIDSDGDIDLVFANEKNTPSWIEEPPTWGWYENVAGANAAPEYIRHGLGTLGLGSFASASADFNNDGVAEFIISRSNQVLLYNPRASVQLAQGFHRFGVNDSRLLTVSDNDENIDIEQTVTISASHGQLSLAAADNLTYVTGDGELDRTITVRGTDIDINNALNGLLYQPDNNYFGLDKIEFSAADAAGSNSLQFPFWVLGSGTVLEAATHFTELQAITVAVKFTEPVSGLTKEDFIISGGATAADSIAPDANNPYLYNLTITPVIFTDILIQLPANSAQGSHGAQNTAAQLLVCSPTSSACGTPPTVTPGDDNNGGNQDNVPALADSSEQAPAITVGTSNERRTQSLPTFHGQLGRSRFHSEIADLDKDGDSDFIVSVFNSVGNGGLIWFENTGQNSVENPSFNRHQLENGTNTYDYKIADIDGDNDLDIVAVSQRATNVWEKTRQDRLAWFEKTDNGYSKHVIENSEGGSSLNVIDLNDDNKPDLVVSNRNGTTIYYQTLTDGEVGFSGGADNIIASSESFAKSEESVQTYTADFDKNGSLEIFVAEANGRYRLIQKTGVADNKAEFSIGEQFSGDYQNPIGVREPSTLRAGDINDDGWLDLISSGMGSGSSADLVVYFNDQDGGFTAEVIAKGSGMDDAKLRDIDRDGDLDIVYSTTLQTPETIWQENSGNTPENSVNWKQHKLNSNFYTAVDSADFNGDEINDWLFNTAWIPGAAPSQRSDQLTQFGHNQGYPLTVSHPNENQILQLEIRVTQGTVTLANFDNIAFEQGDGRDDSILTIRGTQANLNGVLDGLIYAMDSSFAGQTQMTLSVNDGTHSHTQTLTIQVLAVDLAIAGPDSFSVNQPITLEFNFTQGVSGFSAGDIQLSGSATQVVSNSFSQINPGKYQVQVTPVTTDNLLVKVDPNVASSSDQAKNAGAIALFCASGPCEMASGSSDSEGLFPQAGEIPGSNNQEPDTPQPETPGGENPGTSTPEPDNPGTSVSDGGSSGGGGSAWYLLLVLSALTLRRKHI